MEKKKSCVVGSTKKKPYQTPEIQVIKLANTTALLSASNGTQKKISPSLPEVPVDEF